MLRIAGYSSIGDFTTKFVQLADAKLFQISSDKIALDAFQPSSDVLGYMWTAHSNSSPSQTGLLSGNKYVLTADDPTCQ